MNFTNSDSLILKKAYNWENEEKNSPLRGKGNKSVLKLS